MSKYIILLITLFSFGLLAQINEEYVLYPESINAPTKSFSKEYLEEHFQDYKKMYEKIGGLIPDHYPMMLSIAYYYKINLKKYKELKKIGFDIVDLSKRYFIFGNFCELSVLSELLFTGTVVDIVDIPDPSSRYRSYFMIKVDEILKGNEFFDKKPDFIKSFYHFGSCTVEVNGKKRIFKTEENGPKYTIGDKYLFFDIFIGDNIRNKYNTAVYPSGKGIIYVDEVDFIEFEYKDPVDFNVKTNLRQAGTQLYKEKEIVDLKKFIKKYEEINDTPNFYNRSYK